MGLIIPVTEVSSDTARVKAATGSAGESVPVVVVVVVVGVVVVGVVVVGVVVPPVLLPDDPVTGELAPVRPIPVPVPEDPVPETPPPSPPEPDEPMTGSLPPLSQPASAKVAARPTAIHFIKEFFFKFPPRNERP